MLAWSPSYASGNQTGSEVAPEGHPCCSWKRRTLGKVLAPPRCAIAAEGIALTSVAFNNTAYCLTVSAAQESGRGLAASSP